MSAQHEARLVSSAAALTERQLQAWRWAIGSWLALVALLIAWEWFIAPVRPGGSWLVLKAVPLLLPLPWMLRGNKDAIQWALLIVLVYLVEATVRIFEPAPYGLLALIELVLVCVFFVAAVLYLRPFKQAAKAAAQRAKAERRHP
ncbi:MAG: DUF2069 domain-containing protein [Betaproteobacteria bacterium]